MTMRQCKLLLVLLLLAGCTSLTNLKHDVSERMFGQTPANPPAALTEFKPTTSATVAWSAKVGNAGNYDFTPAVDGSAVFAASMNGDITRLDAASGKLVWRVNAGEPLSGGVGVGSNLVLVGTPAGWVLAFDQNGKPLWKAKVSSEVLSAPKVSRGVVVVRCGDSRVFGLSAADGMRLWVYERSMPPLTLRSSAGVLIANDVAYIGFAGGKLIALDIANGKTFWEASVALPKGVTEIERIADITSLPDVEGDIVYAVAFQGRMAGIDRSNGRVLWTRDISSYTGLDVEDSRIFLSHSSGAVYALDPNNGKSYWRQGGLLNRQLSAPLAMARLVAVGDLEGYVHLLSRDNGAFAARIQTEKSPVMTRLVRLNLTTLLAQTRGGGLYAITLK